MFYVITLYNYALRNAFYVILCLLYVICSTSNIDTLRDLLYVIYFVLYKVCSTLNNDFLRNVAYVVLPT